MKKSTIFLQIGLLVLIMIVLNVVSSRLYFRLDFTEDERYTLSKATKDVLKDLEVVVNVKAYFTEDLPPQLAYVRKDIRDMLIEYEDRAGGNLVFEFVNPNESEELKQEALQAGVAPVAINVVQNDQRQQMQAFMGLVFKSGKQTEVIPILQPGASMEYDVTTSIKKISITDKPKLGFIQGMGEPAMQEVGQLMQQLSILYQIENVDLNSTENIPMSYRSLIWIDPSDTLDYSHFQKLDNFLNQGGNLFLSFTAVKGDLQNGLLSSADDIGLAGWLATKGIAIGDQFVIDASCASVSVRQQSGFFTINSQVEFPYFPRVSTFEKHPITGGLEGLLFPFISNIQVISQDSSVTISPLLKSSENAGLVSAPAYIDIQKRWTERDFTVPSQTLAVAVEGLGQGNGRLVAIPNASFIINGSGQQAQQLNPDNVNFASNAIDWLSDDTGLIALRTKGVTNRPLDSIEDSTKNLLKYGNVFLPILLLLIYGFVRKTNNARKRQRWIQGDYR